MKHKQILLGLIAGGLALAWGAPPDPSASLERSAQFVRGAKNIAVEFELQQNYTTGDSLRQKGELLLGAGERFRLKLPGLEYYSDGKTLWEYRPGAKQVLARPLAEMASGFHPSKMLFQYLECSAVSAVEERVAGKKLIRLSLNPLGKLASLKELDVWLDPSNWAPVQLRALDASGNRSRYIFTKMKVNSALQPSDFQFATPLGVELLDLR